MRWFPVALLTYGVFIVTRAGFELTSPAYESARTIRKRQLKFVRHCLGSENQPVRKQMLWQPSNPLKKGQGRRYTQIKQIAEDLPQLTLKEMNTLSQNRDRWKEVGCEAKNATTPATPAD